MKSRKEEKHDIRSGDESVRSTNYFSFSFFTAGEKKKSDRASRDCRDDGRASDRGGDEESYLHSRVAVVVFQSSASLKRSKKAGECCVGWRNDAMPLCRLFFFPIVFSVSSRRRRQTPHGRLSDRSMDVGFETLICVPQCGQQRTSRRMRLWNFTFFFLFFSLWWRCVKERETKTQKGYKRTPNSRHAKAPGLLGHDYTPLHFSRNDQKPICASIHPTTRV